MGLRIRGTVQGRASSRRGASLASALMALVVVGLTCLVVASVPVKATSESSRTKSTPTPVVAQVLTQTTVGASVTLPRWAPSKDDLVLVAVATQAWRSLPVAVRGNDLPFERAAQVRNAQGIGSLDVFRAQGRSSPGPLTVDLPGNSGPAVVLALRVAGAAVGSNGKAAVRALRVEDGPEAGRDNGDMLTTVPSSVGDLVLGLGTHRLRQFQPPDSIGGSVAAASAGTAGDRVAAEAWTQTAAPRMTTVGSHGNLVGGSGKDDWALVALAVRPDAGATSPLPSDPPSDGVTSPVDSGTSPAAARRPYDDASPWNTPIPADARPVHNSAALVKAVADNGLPLTADVDQYAVPVYTFDARTPRRTVKMSGYFSSYDDGDDSRVGAGHRATIPDVPVPPSAVGGNGSDGQIVIWDPSTHVEYGFWQFRRDASGGYVATNGYRYHTGPGYHGRFADGRAGRGAGTTYLAGLVRPWEIARGRVDHALAFAYDAPSDAHVYPASKSDGVGSRTVDLPEGTRLQLDPTLTDEELAAYGLSREARVIARALQRYGMYVIDNSGSSKVYLEDRTTARWPRSVGRRMLEGIPWSRFRVVR